MTPIPLCLCGHRASDHAKVAKVRAQCQWWPRHADTRCPCLVYRPQKEKKR